MLSFLRAAMQHSFCGPMDYHFAKFIHTCGGDPHVQFLAALVSFELHQGHCCIDVSPTSTIPTQHAKLFALENAPTWTRYMPDVACI